MAKIVRIDKERRGAYVAFPRSLYKGISAEDDTVSKDEYTAEQKWTEQMGMVTLLERTEKPRRIFHVIKTTSEQDFDDKLSRLLSIHELPTYIEGNTSFLVLFAGTKDPVRISQHNFRQVAADITRQQERAALWWKKYGNKFA